MTLGLVDTSLHDPQKLLCTSGVGSRDPGEGARAGEPWCSCPRTRGPEKPERERRGCTESSKAERLHRGGFIFSSHRNLLPQTPATWGETEPHLPRRRRGDVAVQAVVAPPARAPANALGT